MTVSGMGHFRVPIDVANRDGGSAERVDALVDTGATYTWLPRDVLERLKVLPEDEWPFVLADGREVTYPIAWLNVTLQRADPTHHRRVRRSRL